MAILALGCGNGEELGPITRDEVTARRGRILTEPKPAHGVSFTPAELVKLAKEGVQTLKGSPTEYAAEQVASFGEYAVDPLVEALKDDRSPGAPFLAQALADIRGDKAQKARLSILGSKSAPVRIAALRGIADNGGPIPVDTVAKLAESRESAERIEALRALQDSNEPSLENVFLRHTRDSEPQARLYALEGLRWFKSSDSENALLKATKGEDRSIAGAALAAIRPQHPEVPAAIREIITRLPNEASDAQEADLKLLRISRRPEAEPAFKATLQQPEVIPRTQAVRGYFGLPTITDPKALFDVIFLDVEKPIRDEAAKVLALKQPAGTLDMAMSLAHSDEEARQANGVYLLGKLNDSSAIKDLRELTGSPRPRIRALAIAGLSNILGYKNLEPKLVEELRSMMKSPEASVREATADYALAARDPLAEEVRQALMLDGSKLNRRLANVIAQSWKDDERLKRETSNGR